MNYICQNTLNPSKPWVVMDETPLVDGNLIHAWNETDFGRVELYWMKGFLPELYFLFGDMSAHYVNSCGQFDFDSERKPDRESFYCSTHFPSRLIHFFDHPMHGEFAIHTTCKIEMNGSEWGLFKVNPMPYLVPL